MNYCKFRLDPLRDGEPSCSGCSSEAHKTIPAHRLLPGTLLNGRYCIGKVLGEGGFGITYIGRDMKLDMKVAVKVYYPNGLVNRNNTFSPTVNCSVSDDKVDFFINGRKKFIQEAYDTAQDSEAAQNDIKEQTYPLSDAKEVAQNYALAIINDAAESISYEILDWSTFENGFDNAVMYITNVSTAESAYSACADSLNTDITCAEDLLDYMSSANVDRINSLLGNNANAKYSSCTGNYLNEEEAQPYLDALYSKLDSLSEYGISSDSVSPDNVLQYAKINFTETVSGDVNSAIIEFSIVLGYVEDEWKIIYIESTDTVSVLNSLTIISDLAALD